MQELVLLALLSITVLKAAYASNGNVTWTQPTIVSGTAGMACTVLLVYASLTLNVALK